MKKQSTTFRKFSLLLMLIASLNWSGVYAQLRIGGSSSPTNPGVALEVVGKPVGNTEYQGLLLPRVELVDYATWTLAGTPVDGMIVFNTATTTGDYAVTPGIYCWYNFHWVRQSPSINSEPAIISSVDCQQSTAASGEYYPAIKLNSANTKQIRITPTSAGSFSAKTNVANGYSFSATGTFTAEQVGISQNITLQGNGTPQTTGLNTFTLTVGIQSCTFNVTVYGPIDCSGPLSGTYQSHIPLTSANTKQITYTPAVAGPYSATTDVVNGYSFSASGTFTTEQIGVPQTIMLQASGTPQAKFSNSAFVNFSDTFILTLGGQKCTFDVSPLFPFDCSGPLNGTYKVGVPLNSTNTKQITYVPNVVGEHYFRLYVLQSQTASFTLSKAITFTNEQVGIPQTIILQGSGTPARQGPYGSTLEIRALTTGPATYACPIEVTVVP
ncbi:hypothetical protein GCM10027592_26560 [Spirosoma flavus]